MAPGHARDTVVFGEEMSGRIIGVGVGPGDPELMTLKAARLIATAPVVAYPVANGTSNRTRNIAEHLFGDATIEMPFALPMTSDRKPAQDAYDLAADEISKHLENNQDVVVLCEGDPLFYGSFMYLAARLGDSFDVEIVPGITSINAAAARLQKPLAARSESVAVMPATARSELLQNAIEAHDTVIILKAGRHLGALRRTLDRLGLLDAATLVTNVSTADESVCPLAAAPETASYFSLVHVSKGRDPWLT